jgi:hypothetical protein
LAQRIEWRTSREAISAHIGPQAPLYVVARILSRM